MADIFLFAGTIEGKELAEALCKVGINVHAFTATEYGGALLEAGAGEADAEEASNTAVAARLVAESNDLSLGAIASVETAEVYGLKVLEANINKSGENTTRFAVLSKVRANSPTFTSSVLMFTVKHEVGSLANAINIIGKHGYNMTALRSRPLKKHSWQYYFYIEIDGTIDTDNGAKMIDELNKVCNRLKVAGTFAPQPEI